MNTNDTTTIERETWEQDGEESRRSAGQKFSIKVGNDRLEFRKLKIEDPVPTGRQIIEAAGFSPADEHLIFEVSHDRRLCELKLDETTNLSSSGKERFLVFDSDRSWRGIIDGKRFEWGAREITGHVLKWLSNVNSGKYGVWLERAEEPDLLIGDDEAVSLDPAGVERFRTDRLFKICIEDQVIPWDSKTITTEQIAELGGWDVPQGVIEVDEEQNERTLKPGEVVKLRPGVSYGKKLCFKRGAA